MKNSGAKSRGGLRRSSNSAEAGRDIGQCGGGGGGGGQRASGGEAVRSSLCYWNDGSPVLTTLLHGL
jgi:hypothetical protein